MIGDGWSMGVFVKELAALYESHVTGRPSPLTPLPIQYGEWASRQREWMRGAEFDRQLRYWTERLRGALPVLELPADRPRPAVQSLKGARHRFLAEPDLLERLRTLCRKEGVTLFMTLFAAFNALLCRHTGQEDILVGTPIANRTSPEVEGLLGCSPTRSCCVPMSAPPFSELLAVSAMRRWTRMPTRISLRPVGERCTGPGHDHCRSSRSCSPCRTRRPGNCGSPA
jgi:hypothetical protein